MGRSPLAHYAGAMTGPSSSPAERRGRPPARGGLSFTSSVPLTDGASGDGSGGAPADGVLAHEGSPRRRTRDRHGRGVRGPLLAPVLPAWRTRADKFDDAVLAAVERLERLGWAQRIAGVEFAVEDVPPPTSAPEERGTVLLARHVAADRRAGTSDRVVLYRRPIEDRCEDAVERDELVRSLLAEQVGHLLGLAPEEIDPGAGV